MSRILNISQPRVYPHITYLDKIAQSDLFIVSDDLVVKKNLFEIRNKYFCRLSKKPQYLNFPIEKKVEFFDLKIKNHQDIFNKHRKILHDNYKRYPHYNDRILPATLPNSDEHYMGFFLSHLQLLMGILDIHTPIEFASAVKTSKKGQERLVDIITHYNGTDYISGICGSNYIHELPVPFVYHDSNHPRFHDYRPNDDNWYMIYDMIFSIGLDAVKKIIHR
jgi:hypothetical protein